MLDTNRLRNLWNRETITPRWKSQLFHNSTIEIKIGGFRNEPSQNKSQKGNFLVFFDIVDRSFWDIVILLLFDVVYVLFCYIVQTLSVV